MVFLYSRCSLTTEEFQLTTVAQKQYSCEFRVERKEVLHFINSFFTMDSNQPPTQQSKKAHTWIRVTKMEESKLAFIQDANKRDLCLFREISVSLPFEAKYGDITSLWKDVAERISNVQEGDGELLFGEAGVSSKVCTDRFKLIMDWCSKYQKDQPFRSGCDDEDAPTELIMLIEEMHERWQEFKTKIEEISLSKANQ